MDAPACLLACLKDTPIYAWLPVAAWIAGNLVTGLTQYSDAVGPLGKLKAIADWLSVVSHADKPGTFKMPGKRSRKTAKGGGGDAGGGTTPTSTPSADAR